MHSTATTIMRRTPVICSRRSGIVSGRAASPTAPIVSSSIIRSGRRGGSGRTVRCAMSTMLTLRGERRLDPVGEQQIVDAPMQRLERGRADVGKAEMIGVQLGLHAAGMRRKDEDAAADQQCLLDRMRDE